MYTVIHKFKNKEYLEVFFGVLKELDIVESITPYSKRNQDTVYLEPEYDAPFFKSAWENHFGVPFVPSDYFEISHIPFDEIPGYYTGANK